MTSIMERSAIDDLASRLCSLKGPAANADAIARLIWMAHDAAASGDLDASEATIVAARAQLEAAERQVGIMVPLAEAKVAPRFDHGGFAKLKRGGA